MSAIKVTRKSKSIADKIMAVGDVPNYTAALFYGESGTGKTTVAASFPKPLLVLDLREKGTETIAKYEGIDVLSIEDWKEFEEAFWMLDSESKYETVVLDQISALQSLGMDKIRIDNGMEPGDTFSKRDWGTLSGMMQTWLLNYRNLWSKEKHIVFLAHQRTFGGDDEAGDNQITPTIGARLSPSVESFVNGAVSTIGNTFIRERYVAENPKKPGKKTRYVDYCMRVGPHANFRTKIRKPPDSDAVPDVIVNPTFEKIMRLSRGEGIVKKVRK